MAGAAAATLRPGGKIPTSLRCGVDTSHDVAVDIPFGEKNKPLWSSLCSRCGWRFSS